MRWWAFVFVALLAACDVAVQQGPVRPVPAAIPADQLAVSRFSQVVRTVEPVAEQVCREQTRGVNCDFRIVIDDTPNAPPNAFQTLSRSGRPIIAFTPALIVMARNQDELAFVLGHEAAHHVSGHIARQRENATFGAVLLGGVTALTGGDATAIREAQEMGAFVGARSYSKEFELEADALGTVIAARAGYDPLIGVEFFDRIPDPGDRFLGTHPPNADRVKVVRRTAAGL